jgi:hypothetical protein
VKPLLAHVGRYPVTVLWLVVVAAAVLVLAVTGTLL